uniref:Uncharacterized protein n=1 Tax=Fervidobacterium pennivorans TaxID=93466 RepID=A0A7V4KET7_FERPE
MSGCVLRRKPNGKLEKVKVSNPLLNEKGRQEILMIIRKRVDQIIHSTSILDMAFVREEIFYFNINLINLISQNAEAWEFDVSHFNEFIDSLVVAVECIYRKALNGVFLNRIFGIPIEVQKERKWIPS